MEHPLIIDRDWQHVRAGWSWNTVLLLMIAVLSFAGAARALDEVHGDEPAPQRRAKQVAHAHNDYQHPRPLLDALDHGFGSVEADVFLQDGELLVGHERKELRPERTLERLYLVPLSERVRARGGHVQDAQSHFYLLIDIKSEGKSTYEAIHSRLADYPQLFSFLEEGVWTRRAITAVISGNVPHEVMLKQTVRYAGIDGRPIDLQSQVPAHAMPWISANWKTLFQWRGEGLMPPAEQEKLRQYVADAHSKGRLVRFWAAPENTNVWQEFRDQGVDLIGTDDLQKLQKFCDPPRGSIEATRKK